MTRINVSINVKALTDEHLLAEHREIKRLPNIKFMSNDIPNKFKLGSGHVKFFSNKHKYTFDRYNEIYQECLNRGFNVENYSSNWGEVTKNSLDYIPTEFDKKLLIDRISERINNSRKTYFHYYGKQITKNEAIEILVKH